MTGGTLLLRVMKMSHGLVCLCHQGPRFLGRFVSVNIHPVAVKCRLSSQFTLNTAPTPTPHSDSGDFRDFVALPSPEEVDALRFEDNIVPNNNNSYLWKMPEPVHYTTDMKAINTNSHSRSVYTNTTVTTNSDEDLSGSMLDSVTGRHPPATMLKRATTNGTAINVPMEPPAGAADARNERRYRHLLEHEFNSSCEIFYCGCQN